jgi:lipoate-protein ligase A
MWRVLDTGKASAHRNMELSRELLASLGHLGQTVLHCFEWARPSITYGVLVRAEQLLDLEATTRLGLDLAQRPTGGGVMFHVEDLSFSLAVPASSPCYSSSPERNYAWVNQAVARAIERTMGRPGSSLLQQALVSPNPRAARFCMSVPTRYDVLWNNRKVGGAAQRCTRHGFLHQGSIALVPTPAVWLEQSIRAPEGVRMGMDRHAGSLLETQNPPIIQDLRRALMVALSQELAEAVAQQHDAYVGKSTP